MTHTDPTGDPTAETARALLYRYGLPEDVIDGALCLYAQELAAVQRREADDLHQTEPGVVKGLRIGADLIDPAKGAAASAVVSPLTDPAAVLTEAAEHLLARCPHLGKPGALRKCTCPAAEELLRLASQERGAPDYASTREALLRRLAVEAHDAGTQQQEAEPPTEEQIVREHVTSLHLIGEQLATIESWMWQHLADVREVAAEPAPVAPQPAVVCVHPDGYDGECPCPPSCTCCQVTAAEQQPAALPPPQGPEYTPCECGHIEPEHEPDKGLCFEDGCDCMAYRPTPPAPLCRSEDDCPGFPERCPNLRPVDPEPGVHLGGIRCGCADA